MQCCLHWCLYPEVCSQIYHGQLIQGNLKYIVVVHMSDKYNRLKEKKEDLGGGFLCILTISSIQMDF